MLTACAGLSREREVPVFDRLAIMRHWYDDGQFDLYAATKDMQMAKRCTTASAGRLPPRSSTRRVSKTREGAPVTNESLPHSFSIGFSAVPLAAAAARSPALRCRGRRAGQLRLRTRPPIWSAWSIRSSAWRSGSPAGSR